MKKYFLLLIAMAICAIGNAQFRPGRMPVDENQINKIAQAYAFINMFYVDSISAEKTAEDAINGMLEKLDPHSSYTNAEETRRMNESMQGGFGGIGVQFNMLDDTLVVMQVVKGGPSEKAGILPGDRITEVNGITLAGVKMKRDTIMKNLRGEEGTKAVLKVVRRGVNKIMTFKLIRGQIPTPTLDAYYMIKPGIGYIHLDRFGATSADEVKKAIKDLQKQGMTKLIFDLQANGGGYLDAAVDIASHFLPEQKLVVYTEGRVQSRTNLMSKGGGVFQEGGLAILVDETTASASEIVSGAVQDYDRGIIVGRRTFGKGLVQRPVPLNDGSMIRLTIAHYYTPTGRCIQKPYEKGKKEDYYKDFEERYDHGELISLDSIHLDSTQVYETFGKGRKVYGGGGIMPDYFVPLDTTKVTKYHMKLRRTDIITSEVLRFSDQHRNELKAAYPEFIDYIDFYEVPQSLSDSIRAKAKVKGIEPESEEEWNKTQRDLKTNLKALIAYDIWDRNEYFKLLNKNSDIVKKALEVLETEGE